MTEKKILVYRLGSLGDTVMCLPCFHLVRDLYPGAEIVLLTGKPAHSKAAPVEEVLGKEGYFFNSILHYAIGTRNPFVLLNLIRKIRMKGIHTMVNLAAARSPQSTLRDRIFFRLAGIRKQYGFPHEERDYKVGVDPVTGQYEWEAKRLARRISMFGHIDLDNPHFWDLRLSEAECRNAFALAERFSGEPVMVISVGTKMQAKDWGRNNWIALIRNLSDELKGWQLIMIGATEEKEIADLCLKEWKGKGLNLCGKASVREAAVVLKNARLFVGHDSGPMHLAASVGTPCVAVFSARNLPEQWYPRGSGHKIIYHKTDCAGCLLEVCIEQQKKCILSIRPEEVKQAILEITDPSEASVKAGF